jgi:hypothetical protein
VTLPATGRTPRRFSVGQVALMLPLVAAVVAARLPVRDNSYLWHVRAGTLQIEQGEVLTADPFSFTALGRPWRTQSWLADLLYGWADSIWSLETVTPLVLAGALVMVGAIGLRVYRTVPVALPAAIGTIWVMWLTIGYFTPRPVLFSLALLAVLLVAADDQRLRWALPLVMWLWASVHGGFIVGLGYLALDGLRRRDRNRLVDIGAATAVTFFTAHGWGTWQVVLKFLRSSGELDLIVEWLTPDLFSIEHFPFALAVVAMLVGAINGRIIKRDLWVVIPFLLFAFTANRSVPIAALVLAPWFVSGLARASRPGSQVNARQSAFNAGVIVAVVVVPWLVPLEGGLDQELFAVEAIRHLQPGRAFHDDAVGGYLIYEQWPERLVYIDDRAELYEDDFADFVNARGGAPGWEEVFERFELSQALLKVTDPLGEVLIAGGWIETYRDDRFVLLVQG